MSEPAQKSKLSPVRNILSMILFIVAGVLLVFAAYLFWDDRNQESAPSAPTAVPGHAQLKTVYDALVAEGLDAEVGRQTARIDGVTPPGQELIVDEQSVYVFIFTDPQQREQELDGVEAADIGLTDAFGDPVTTEPLALASGSNVAVVMPASNADLVERIETAVATIS